MRSSAAPGWCASPNADGCLRLIRALCVEIHETWLENSRHLNMMRLAEQKKEVL